ncbi:MAG: putative sulfate exporter family transporter, partial [Actinomycetota bacterium]
MKLTAPNIRYSSIILSGVALAYLVNQIEGAISPLFFSMVLGIILGNTMDWSRGKPVITFASRKVLRLGVV